MSDQREPIQNSTQSEVAYNLQPFRIAVFRGMALVLPPLLTFVILLWIASSVEKILNPIESATRQATVWLIDKTKTEIPVGAVPNAVAEEMIQERARRKLAETKEAKSSDPQIDDVPSLEAESESRDLKELIAAIARIERRLDIDSAFEAQSSISQPQQQEPQFEDSGDGTIYVALGNGEWIPLHVRDAVNEHVRESGIPLENGGGRGYYKHYVQYSILKRSFVIPVFFAGFILLMYLLGKFLAAGVGRYFWNSMENVINQLPIIRTVYSSVKQVTDFFVGESETNDFQRVVAVEYPRKGVWSLGFVTGESMLTIRGAVDGEPIVSVLMPTSPVPGTGFTISVRKSETIDVDIPIEQALQFVVSCGVVIPDGEIQEHITAELESRSEEGELKLVQ